MKGVEITGENLEDLLAYDDLFLDYFNAFLALPVFPQALAYNRLTGGFDEVQGLGTAMTGSGGVTPPYGITDEERERMLEWAKEERLPLFLQTQLFREFKLAKLLLRPLEDRNSASNRGSSHTVRGYSRQTESYVSSLSNSADNSANEVVDQESDLTWSEFRQSAFQAQERPNSRAVSLPAQYFASKPGKVPSIKLASIAQGEITGLPLNPVMGDGEKVSQNSLIPGISDEGQSASKREETGVSFYQSEAPEEGLDQRRSKTPQTAYKHNPFYRDLSRAVSAPTNYREYLKFPSYSDFDVLFGLEEPEPTGQHYVMFHDEGISEEQTETDMKNLEGRLKMSFQQMKEQVLGTYDGMEELKGFLSDTAGIHLLNFWLDCEYFKDTMEDFDEVSNMENRNRLFRDIQDKYKMNLTKDAKDHLLKAANNVGLSHTVFIHTQYDVLRRLRAYWVLRFLIHLERRSTDLSWPEREVTWRQAPVFGRQLSSMSIFPSISLVNSLPVQAEVLKALTKLNSWEVVSKGGSRFTDRVKSARSKLQARQPSQPRPLRDGLTLALTADKSAGGPFQRFLTRQGNSLHLSMLLFWQDVTDYGAAEDRSADRLLRLNYAWTIFRKYMTADSENNIVFSNIERECLIDKLTEAKDFIEVSVFDSVKGVVVEQLEKAWLRFLKEDLKTFLEFGCDEDTVPPSTASVVEITETEDHQILITRPRPWVRRYPGSTETERARRLRSALSLAESIDEERRAEKRRQAKERRKEMERERRKAIKAARMRQKAAKNKKASPTGRDEQTGSAEGDLTDGHEPKPVNFVDMASNKQLVILFKKYLQDKENKETLNSTSLYMDIQTYTSMGTGKDHKQKKDLQAALIQKTYLDQNAKKHTALPDKITSKLAGEKDRPRTPLLKEIQAHILPAVDESFKVFVEVQAESMGLDPQSLSSMFRSEMAMRLESVQAESMGLDPQSLSSMSRSEMAMRLESDSSLMTGWNKKKGKSGKDKVLDKQGSFGDSSVGQEEVDPQGSSSLGDQTQSELTDDTLSSPDVRRKVRFTPHPCQSDTAPGKPVAGKRRFRDVVLKAALKRGEHFSEKSSSAMTNSNRRGKKQTGRSQPTKDDKVGFLMALNQSVMGRISIQLLYFYKYLVKHGEEDGYPMIDRDLIFYLEVQKFKECSHIFADEEMLKRKVQCIVECFLESITPPNVQIGVSAEIQQKTLKAAQKYLTGKDVSPAIFDEAQFAVFKDLLFYWAGFRRSYQPPADPDRAPTTKLQKMLRKRLEAIDNYQMPGTRFVLPEIPGASVATYSFTLHEGVKCRDGGLEDFSMETPAVDKGEVTSRLGRHSAATNMEGYPKRSRGRPMATPSTAASSAAFPRSSLAVR